MSNRPAPGVSYRETIEACRAIISAPFPSVSQVALSLEEMREETRRLHRIWSPRMEETMKKDPAVEAHKTIRLCIILGWITFLALCAGAVIGASLLVTTIDLVRLERGGVALGVVLGIVSCVLAVVYSFYAHDGGGKEYSRKAMTWAMVLIASVVLAVCSVPP